MNDKVKNEFIKSKLKRVLSRAATILFPLRSDEVKTLVKKHTWRDRNYVGFAEGRVSAWSGYSINLAYLDSRYRGLFADVVQNNLPNSEKIRLFGEDFTAAISGLENYVVIFNLDIPFSAVEIIKSLGFIPRNLKRNCHICLIYSVDYFLEEEEEFISLKTAEMVILQR